MAFGELSGWFWPGVDGVVGGDGVGGDGDGSWGVGPLLGKVGTKSVGGVGDVGGALLLKLPLRPRAVTAGALWMERLSS